MIGLAFLCWLCRHIDGLEVGVNAFYEDLPLDYETGALYRYGVYVTTESAPISQGSDNHQFVNVLVAIGEGALDANGCPVAEKYETDRILDDIQELIFNALEYSTELCRLCVPDTNIVHRDVRVLPSSSKLRGGTLPNGAIMKSLTAEIYYK